MAADADTIEIDTGMQSAPAIDTEIPVDGIGVIVWCTMLLMLPQMMASHVENVENDIHIATNAVVDDADACCGGCRIVGAFHIDEIR